jgi:hypothetical protein
MDTFSDWLFTQMKERGWPQADLATDTRSRNISPSYSSAGACTMGSTIRTIGSTQKRLLQNWRGLSHYSARKLATQTGFDSRPPAAEEENQMNGNA